MAQLKDTLVSGNLRVTDTILADIVQVDTIKARSSSASTTMSPGTAGQMLISNGTNVYWDTWVGSGNITTVGTISTGVWNATEISAIKGGTGITTYTKGDILYASAANTLAKLAANTTATKKFLTMTSSTPSWGTIASGDLPSMYIGTTQVQYSSAAQALSGITTLTTSGKATLNSLEVTGASALKSTLSVTGNTTLSSNVYLGTSGTAHTGWTNGQYLQWDNTNKAWHLIGNFYADGFISAGGLSTSGSGGGGDAIAVIGYDDVKALASDSDFTTASAWATHLFYRDVFGSGNTTIVSRISALENSSTNVTYTANQSSGTLLGTITIDGNANNIYAPTIPTSLKNPYSLKFGTKSYDGSAEKTIKAEDLSACVMGTVVGTVTITT